MKTLISSETLFEEFVENRDCSQHSSSSSPLHKASDYEYCLHDGGERRDILWWRQGVASKGHSRKNVGSLQDVFRKRVQRYQGPTMDISVRRLWDNNQHDRRTCQLRGIRNATATGGRASKFGHIDGSRKIGSGRAIHQQLNANTRIADINSNNRNA